MKTQIYPKSLYVTQINNVTKEKRSFVQIVNTGKEEKTFRAQAISMEPNFSNDIYQNKIWQKLRNVI